MKIIKKYLSIALACIFCFLFLCLNAGPVAAQEVHPYNRFQYHKYSWSALHTDMFHVYIPKGYDSLASFASVQLPDIMAEVKMAMGFSFKEKPNLVIYPSPDQLYESNIGLRETQVQTFPTINLKGNRVLVAFDGSWEHFRLQLKEAWVRFCWEEQFKNDAEEQLTNRKQLMPAWFKKGIIRYYSKGWTIEDEAALAEVMKPSVDTRLHQDLPANLHYNNESLYGQAFCYFLSKQYREDAPKQVLYQLRRGKTLQKAVRLVTKRRLDTLQSQCFVYYTLRQSVATGAEPLPADTLKPFLEKTYKGRVEQLNWNQDSTALFFTIADRNYRDLYIGSSKKLFRSKEKAKPFTRYLMPPWLDDFERDSYPVVSWNDKGNMIDVIMPVKGKMVLQRYDLNGSAADTRTLYGVDGVNSIAEWNRQYLLSAYRRGRSDIISYDPQRLRYHPLTSDQADHTQLTLSAQTATIAYRSGYPADSLYHVDSATKQYGVYFKTIEGNGKEIAKAKDRLVAKDSAFITWQNPVYQKNEGLTVEGTLTGKLQRSAAGHLSGSGGDLTPWLKDYIAAKKTKDSIRTLLSKLKDQDVSFLKNVLTPGDDKGNAALHEDSVRRALAYTSKKVRPYILQLFSAYFSAQINNDYYINRYQPFQAYLGTFKFPEVGAMAQGGFSDLFDNHHFNIGYRLPAGNEGSDFFVRYENTARKLDWHVSFFRKVESLQPDPQRDWKDSQGNPYPQTAKVKTHYYELGFHYPLHYDWSLDFTTAARRDCTIFLATDRYSLNYEALQAWWSISTLSLKVHKLQPTIPFLYKGWEAKATLDFMASTGQASTLVYGTQFKFAWHQPLVKDITIVAQLQGGYSNGDSKILYNFGGLDNNIVPRVDTSVRFGQQAPYAFQALVTPFRGYQQNSLYGSQYGLLNVDVYFPLFRSLIPLKTGFGAVNNLQLGLFTDVAMASESYAAVPVKSPLYAYGFSARTMLAGYPIRFDMAWPGSFDKKPVWYLSLTIK